MIKLGIMLGYSGKQIKIPMDIVTQAEELGFDSVWTAEAYGSDAVSVASAILAQTQTIKVGTCIMQMPAALNLLICESICYNCLRSPLQYHLNRVQNCKAMGGGNCLGKLLFS